MVHVQSRPRRNRLREITPARTCSEAPWQDVTSRCTLFLNDPYRQPGNLNDAMRVLQLNVPLAFRYSVVYQKVQSSTGSTVIAL